MISWSHKLMEQLWTPQLPSGLAKPSLDVASACHTASHKQARLVTHLMAVSLQSGLQRGFVMASRAACTGRSGCATAAQASSMATAPSRT